MMHCAWTVTRGNKMADANDSMSTSENKKKARAENFDSVTLSFLLDEIEKYTDVINSKQTNFVTNKKKNEAWQSIADAVNARGGVPRTVAQLKEKYRKAVSKAKMQFNVIKRSTCKTGGGDPPKEPSESCKKLWELNANTPSFTGIENGVELGIVSTETVSTSKDVGKVLIDGTQDQSELEDSSWVDVLFEFDNGSYNADDTTAVGRNSQQVVKSQIDLTSSEINRHTDSTSHNDTGGRTPLGSNVHGKDNSNDELIPSLKPTVGKRPAACTNLQRGKQSKGISSAHCNRTKPQGAVNLRNLQIQTLTVEKRKSEVEIEKLQQETKKLKTEINKLEEERDLYRIQKDYFRLKLKKLQEEMNEQ